MVMRLAVNQKNGGSNPSPTANGSVADIGKAAVSKTVEWRFDSFPARQIFDMWVCSVN